MFIPILLGTAREGRRSGPVADFVESVLKDEGVETQVFDPKEHLDKPVTGRAGNEFESGSEWQKAVERADGLIIITPEYNHGYPGELKLMFDQLYSEYNQKPIAVVGVSSGGIGGARAVEQVKQIIIGVDAIPVKSSVYFSNAGEAFDEKGQIKDEEFKERVKKMLESIKKYLK